MILLDDRIGSKELAQHLPKGSFELTRLEYGDAAIMGNGLEGVPVPVGIERKAIKDLVNSMVRGRISGHQLPGLLNSYERVYLVVEGTWRGNPHNGMLEVWAGSNNWQPLNLGSRRFMAREIFNYLNTLEVMSGVMIRQTRNLQDTAQLLVSLHSWWGKDYADHTSHIDVHKGMAAMTLGVHMKAPTLLCRVASELPGIGAKRARDVSRHFRSIMDMMLAEPEEWVKVSGIGLKTANTVVQSIREEEK